MTSTRVASCGRMFCTNWYVSIVGSVADVEAATECFHRIEIDLILRIENDMQILIFESSTKHYTISYKESVFLSSK